MNREHRAVISREVRATDDDPGRFEAVVVTYDTLDDYKTIFDPGCFTDSLKTRLPRITWHHDWSDVIGQWVDFKDSPTELRLIGQLDDFEAVPRAKQAWAQLRSGTIDQFSVGFMRQEVEERDGVEHFTKCQLDEAALVLVGAVPNTKLVAIRSGKRIARVPESAVIDFAKAVAAGEMTKEEAVIALDLVTVDDTPVVPEPPDDENADDDAALALQAAEAEADAALEAAGI